MTFYDKLGGEYYESLENEKLIKFQLIETSRKFRYELSNVKIKELKESLIKELIL